MPRRSDIQNILVIGSGPIVIGQACEFDYSGTQACKVLRTEGYHVVLINSNPATIMTDSETADEIYIEPIVETTIEKILIKENIDAILPTVGGQTALNVALALKESGVLSKHGVKLIGADEHAIRKAENRELFEQAMHELGYATTPSRHVKAISEAQSALTELGLPLVIRPSFTLGGSGGATIYTETDFRACVENGLRLSRIGEVVIEKSIVGWKEFELEVMKDHADNTVIICSIENLDPIGIHTGDSITVAPQQTLSDLQYQTLRTMAIKIIKKIGVDTGGSNVQFAVHPRTGEVIVIEMNPRVSRSSALASKATGFPIAKIAAKLAVGYTLDEIENDITRSTPACFEPSIDYIVVKIPRFAFEKFSQASVYLGVQMKSVGETMAIARTFKEAFQKAIRGLETDAPGFDGNLFSYANTHHLTPQQLASFIETKRSQLPQIKAEIKNFHYERIRFIKDLFYFGLSAAEISTVSGIDPWFIHQFSSLFTLERSYANCNLDTLLKTAATQTQDLLAFHPQTPPHTHHFIRILKQNGFSDLQLGAIFQLSQPNPKTSTTPNNTLLVAEQTIRNLRHTLGIRPVYKIVDTCAGEFEAHTPYFYSSYDEEDELNERLNPKRNRIVIIGGGPNRIGQGIEFDYMCVQASLELKARGYDAVIINSNPETVSTDYDVSSLLFFEPLTAEDTLEVIHAINAHGVIVHFGGQTSLNLSQTLADNQATILGTQHTAIFMSEDRETFRNILNEINALQPESESVFTYPEIQAAAQRIGYPVLIRPSFVLGGRAMKVAHNPQELKTAFHLAKLASLPVSILVDKYLEGALEVDVDLISDGENVIICGILEHIEEAGIHSGDSACFLPPQNIPQPLLEKLSAQAKALAKRLQIIGFMNIQFAIYEKNIYFLEANPRGSRTIPFVSKATGIPWVRLAIHVIMGGTLSSADLAQDFLHRNTPYVMLKEAVLPFNKFPDEDPLLGPEMKSTGEVMGIGENLYEAFYKTQQSTQNHLPFLSKNHSLVDPHAKPTPPCGILISISKKPPALIEACQTLATMGYTLYATAGTQRFLSHHHITATLVHKVDNQTTNIADNDIVAKMIDGTIRLVFNTPSNPQSEISDAYIRLIAQKYGIGVFTTLSAIYCATQALYEYTQREFKVYSIRDIAKAT